MKNRKMAKYMVLLGGIATILLQLSHAFAMSPMYDLESDLHIQQHVNEVDHEHDGEETIDDDELDLLLIHSALHGSLADYLNHDFALPLQAIPITAYFQPDAQQRTGLVHSPPVPPPLV